MDLSKRKCNVGFLFLVFFGRVSGEKGRILYKKKKESIVIPKQLTYGQQTPRNYINFKLHILNPVILPPSDPVVLH